MRRPVTRYAPVGDAYVAYQVFGDGPVDLLYHIGWYSHVEGQWEVPAMARFMERLASFGRVICFDRRGHGMSDPVDLDNVTLEQWMEDVRAVLTAAGSESAALIGGQDAGPMTMLFAATYPELTSALVLINTWACPRRRSDYPWGLPDDARERVLEGILRTFIAEDDREARMFFPGAASASLEDAQAMMRVFRMSTSPGMVQRLMGIALDADVRDVLPLVHVPTLVLHRRDNPWCRVGHGRYLGEHIPNAKYVELPGADDFSWLGEADSLLDEIEEFVTGAPPTNEPDRVLSTVLFTDIVSSTERLVDAGDRRWRTTLERHNLIVRKELERFRGREVATAGDGFLAMFDGPARAVRCAGAIVEGVRTLGIDVRAGVHTGEVELAGDDVAGIAVHIGARVGALAGAGEVLVSRTVVDLVTGSGLSFAERGSHALKGVPGEWQLYAVQR